MVVLEGADAGTDIGRPVTATDADSGERLTYWLTGTGGTTFRHRRNDRPDHEGQGVTLDYETRTTRRTVQSTVSAMSVNVADSSGSNTATTMVTINVIGVDEKPTFDDAGPTTIMRVKRVGPRY